MVGKSVWAVLAGVLVLVLLTTLVDRISHVARVFPPINQPIKDTLALLASTYRVVIGAASARLTARRARRSPMRWSSASGTFAALISHVAT